MADNDALALVAIPFIIMAVCVVFFAAIFAVACVLTFGSVFGSGTALVNYIDAFRRNVRPERAIP